MLSYLVQIELGGKDVVYGSLRFASELEATMYAIHECVDLFFPHWNVAGSEDEVNARMNEYGTLSAL